MTVADPMEGDGPGRGRRGGPPRARLAETAVRLGAALAFALVSPLLLVVAGLVWLDLGRPVLFRQMRAGLGGSAFAIRKFRTMREAADADGRPLPDELRVSRLGRTLRRLRLDELPQLLAIADGRMALVGPRPLLPETVAAQGALGRRRGAVRPGLTGWAQVSGNTLLDARQKLALDIWYVDHRGPCVDARILLETAATVILGERLRPDRIAAAEAHVAARAAADAP